MNSVPPEPSAPRPGQHPDAGAAGRDAVLLRRLLRLQVGLAAIIALLLGLYRTQYFWAALYGSGLAIGNSVLLAQRVKRAARSALRNQGQGAFWLYLASAERLSLAVAGIAIGTMVLKLEILPLLLGLVLVQLGHLGIVLPGRQELRRARGSAGVASGTKDNEPN